MGERAKRREGGEREGEGDFERVRRGVSLPPFLSSFRPESVGNCKREIETNRGRGREGENERWERD